MMVRKRMVRRITALCACILAALSMAAPCLAAAPGTVKIAYSNYDNFIVGEADGGQSGYGAEYLYAIAEYAGWDIALIPMEQKAAQKALLEKTIDLYCAPRQTEAAQSAFDFSLYPVCNEIMNLYAMPGTALYYEDFQTMDGMKVGVAEGSAEEASLRQYAREHGFSYTSVVFPTDDAALDALQSGEVALAAHMGYAVGEPLKLVACFGIMPAYIISAPGSARMAEFNDAQSRLYLDDPTYPAALETACRSKTQPSGDLLLTREEAAYIAAAEPLTVALSVDMAPLEYGSRDGSFGGVTVALYNRIAELTGLRFCFTRRANAPELITQMQRGEIQLMGALAQSENVAKSLQIRQTTAYYDNAMSLIAKDFAALSPSSVVAVPAGYPQFIATAKAAGYTNVREYETFEQCVRAVYKGDADLTYIISMCEGYLLSHAQYAELRTVAASGTQYGVCLGVAQDQPVLYNIINKALQAIPDRELDEIIVSNTAKAVPEQTLGDIFAENGALILLVSLLLAVLAFYGLFHWQRARELRQHHDLLERLYESLPCGVFRYAYEPPHRILSCNNACAGIYGYDDKLPMVGELPDAVVSPGTEAAFQKEFDRCERAGRATTFIRPVTRRDGSQAYTESVMDIVETTQGKVFQEIVIDVTERVVQERETESRYAQEIHRSGSRDTGLLYMAFLDMTAQTLVETDIPIPGVHAGISVSEFVELLRCFVQEFQSEEELAQFTARFSTERLEREYNDGKIEQMLTQRVCMGGQILWLRSELVLRYHPTTGHLMCFDYIRDVTDEFLTGEIARRMAFADAKCFMSVYMKTGCCLQYHTGEAGGQRRTETRYGQTDVIRRLCGRMTEQAASALLRDTALPLVAARLAEKPLYQVFATLIDGGERRDKSLSFFYLDETVGILAVTVADVTEVRAAEVEHGRLLADALQAAKKAGIAKSQFLSRVSHEIRTPLNAVIGYGTIARNVLTEAKTDEQRRQANMKVMDCLTKSDVASKHLLTIINDVLDMSAIESGKISITNDRFDFKSLINSLTSLFYAQARAKGVDLQVRFDARMEEWVVGDQMRVNQVLTNLLSNAVKFTPEGGQVLLTIRPETADAEITVTFTVRDTGIGMSEDYLKRIWEPFEQADAYISRRFGGTGLGLTIIKTLLDLMGGQISVESTPGVGSEFTVTLSFGRTEQPRERTSYDFSNVSALIIDDDRGTCDYMGLLLNRYGVHSTAVHSGAAALDAIASGIRDGTPYTVCFLDWRIPKMDGLETAKRIRALAGDTIPIIVITAYDFSEVTGTSAKLGIHRFLSKPLFQSSVFDLLAELCGSPGATDQERLEDYDFKGARLLLAEDNAMNMEIASRILEAAGFSVDRAWNGQEAVEAFTSAPAGVYKAILMDVQMPVLDGYQATKAIRASSHPEARTIPIIAMTADAFAENIAESFASGMNDHVSKPIDLQTLFDTIKKYI